MQNALGLSNVRSMFCDYRLPLMHEFLPLVFGDLCHQISQRFPFYFFHDHVFAVMVDILASSLETLDLLVLHF